MFNIDFFCFLGLFLGSFLITYLIIPKIILVVKYRRLMDDPNHRSSHSKMVPSLGGIAFYIVLVLGIYFLQPIDTSHKSMSLIPGLLILFIMGLKDDLTVLTPLTKLGSQLLSSAFVLSHPDFQIQNLHGFLFIEHISIFISIPLSAFVMVIIINSFNLIDGIDGLAASVEIVIFVILGMMFYLLQVHFFLGICLLMIGSLLAFLRFNLSSTKKIFMGDTGSLLIGFVIACSVMRLFAMPQSRLSELPFQLENLPLVVMAILIVPFFDTARVFTIRILNNKGPFSPDRNHIHHILIDYLHLSHRKASFLIGVFNVLFVLIFLLFSVSMDNLYLTGIMIFFILCFVYFFYRINFSPNNLRRRVLIRKQLNQISKKSL
jgi:UDP-N-acetylmuramyl pentapeptide phosphotransferase/UDP-N-acetylglucosamine-1-phosphate transferase